MSRSALWRQEANVKERERQAIEVFDAAIEEGRSRHVKGQIPLGSDDATFNINPMLLHNISKSPYFQKCCQKLHDWGGLVDEIYYEVKHLEPWTTGSSKIPSTAFCLLLRLLTLRCTERQMTAMLSHPDSPYIRCIGFLYLRYACDPNLLYGWCEPFLYDEESVSVVSNPVRGETTVGEFLRGLLTDMNYFNTVLPRLPVQMERTISVNLLQAEQVENRAKTNSKMLDRFVVGSRIRGLYQDDENPVAWYDGVIDRIVRTDNEGADLPRPKFLVTFPEYGNTELISLGELDIPHRTSREWDERRGGSRDGGYGYDRPQYDRRGNGSHSRDDGRGRASNSSDNGDLMETVLRHQREKSTAKGKQYAQRPPTFKSSLTSKRDPGRKRSRSPTPPRPKDTRRFESDKNHEKELVSNAKPTWEEVRSMEEKKRKLMAKYG